MISVEEEHTDKWLGHNAFRLSERDRSAIDSTKQYSLDAMPSRRRIFSACYTLFYALHPPPIAYRRRTQPIARLIGSRRSLIVPSRYRHCGNGRKIPCT